MQEKRLYVLFCYFDITFIEMKCDVQPSIGINSLGTGFYRSNQFL